MALIDPGALIQTEIAFAKSSETLDSEKQSMMRSAVKNYTVLVSSTCNAGQGPSTRRETVAARERDEETISNSSSGSTTDSVPPARSSAALQMIQMAYGSRRNSLSVSPPARSVKRLRLSLSSTSSSRSSSVSSISTSSTTVNSNMQSPKSYVITGAHTKTTGRYLNNTSSAGASAKTVEQSHREVIRGSHNFVRRPNAVPPYNNTALGLTRSDLKYRDFDADKPSTSKSGIPAAHVMPNGAVKRRLDADDRYMTHRKTIIQTLRAQGKFGRKRVLSERGELEAKFPVLGRMTLHATWRGSPILNPDGRNAGIGLCNHSNDCFLNSVLQLIVHTPPLARFVGEQHASFSCAKGCFLCDLGHHVRCAMTSTRAFKPDWIEPHLRRIFPSHSPGVQEDAHELLNLILDAVDTAAMDGTPFRNRNPGPGNLDEPRASLPTEQIFGGLIRNQIRCLGCGGVRTNYERFRELNLGINNHDYAGKILLQKLLDGYFEVETIVYKCENCDRKTQVQRRSHILRPPFVLLIQLKRFNSIGLKITSPVSFEQVLRLDSYMFSSSAPCYYQLIAVVQHVGDVLDHGHYNIAVRGFDGRGWYSIDDESIRKMGLGELHNMQAYILVYVRREVPPRESLSNPPAPPSPSQSSSSSSSSAKTNDAQNGSPYKNRMAKRPYAQSFPLIHE